MLVILLFFIVKYIFFKQFIKLLKVKYTYLLWFVLPFFFGTVFHAMVDCLFFSLTTTTPSSVWHTLNCIYYFVNAGSLRQNAVTPFNWFISSYSLNWLANISFVWTTDEWFHQTTTYFFVSFMKTVLQTGKTVLQTVANWKNIFILL